MSTGPGPGVGLGNRPTMGPYGGPTVAFAGIGQPLYDYSGPQQHPYASAAATTLLGSPLNTPSSAFAQQASLMGFDHGIAEDGEVIPLEDMEPWGGSLVAPGHSNLYVKNLPEDVTEQQLEALFRVYGGVDSCRLVRNLKTGASRGYGFVRYKTVEEAVVAINALNGYIAGGNMLEVKFADSDAGPKNPKLPHGTTPCDNLYVRNLPTGWNEGDVISLFMPYGEIVESRLLTAGANERGVGALVRMAAVEQATNAIDGLNGQTAPGGLLPLMVRYADSAEDKARRHQRQLRGSRYSPYPSSTTAGNIPVSAAINAASPDGIPHLSSTSSLPAGFTAFNPTGLPDVPDMSGPQRMDSSEALVASSNWQQQQHAQAGAAGSFAFGGADASTVAASNAKSGSLGSLYVKNLPPEADKLYLYEKFAVYGAISSVKVLTDEMSGICKGVGFVNFLEQAAAMEAIRAMDGLKIGDKHLHVSLQTHRASARGSSGGGFQF